MSRWLRQSTAVTIQMGPALDRADGVTEETALAPTVEISKAGAAFAARSSATAIAHDQNGWYRVELNATDTGTAGPLVAKFDDAATHLPVWHEFMVVPAVVYDALVAGTDNLDVNAVQWAGAATASDDLALKASLAKGADITGFNDLSAAQVNAEVLDVLAVDAFAEPGQEAPPAAATLARKLGYLYKAWRNRHTQTATTYSLYGDDATTVDHKATVADDGTTFERTEIASGP
jgi:hypothetical protein